MIDDGVFIGLVTNYDQRLKNISGSYIMMRLTIYVYFRLHYEFSTIVNKLEKSERVISMKS